VANAREVNDTLEGLEFPVLFLKKIDVEQEFNYKF